MFVCLFNSGLLWKPLRYLFSVVSIRIGLMIGNDDCGMRIWSINNWRLGFWIELGNWRLGIEIGDSGLRLTIGDVHQGLRL